MMISCVTKFPMDGSKLVILDVTTLGDDTGLLCGTSGDEATIVGPDFNITFSVLNNPEEAID